MTRWSSSGAIEIFDTLSGGAFFLSRGAESAKGGRSARARATRAGGRVAFGNVGFTGKIRSPSYERTILSRI